MNVHSNNFDFDTLVDQDTISESFYDKAGRVIRTKDANEVETFFEYDALGQQTAVIQSNVIDESGAVVHDYLRTETAYDELGRRVLVRENISQGNPLEAASIDDLLARNTHYEYNSAGNLEAVILPAADDPDVADPSVVTHPRYEYTYDIYGNLKSIKDNIKQDDPLVATTDSSAARETLFTYDEEHRQLTRTLPIGVSTSGNPSDFIETNAYNSLGQLDHSIDFEGRVTRFGYDTFGRLEQERFYWDIGDPIGTPAQTRDYTVDALGRTVQIDDDLGGIWTSVYDARRRLTQEVSPQGIVNYGYNDLDQLTHTFTSDTELATNAITDTLYDYDVLGRLKTVTAVERNGDDVTINEQTVYTYDTLGNLDTVTLPNGVVSDLVYDELNRLVELEHRQSGGQVISRYEYDLALDGKRVRSEEYDDAGLVAAFDWVYDDLGRLSREIYDGPGTAEDFKALYYFDLVGNRLRKSGDADQTPGFEEDTRYTYDDNDRLLTEIFKVNSVLTKSTTYQYGVSNDRTELTQKRVDDVIAQIVEETDYTYNLQGRFEKVGIDTNDDGFPENQITYRYNPDGIRVYEQVEEDPDSDGAIDQTTEKHFLIDANNLTGFAQVLEEKSSPIALPDRSYTLGLDLIGQQAPGVENDNPLFYLYDGLGSVRGLIDPTGQKLSSEIYVYDAFGNPVGFNSATALSVIQYRGEQTDGLTGFQYLRGRYLRPSTGTFTRLDPFFGILRDPQTFHEYGYVQSNPTNFVDPSGNVRVRDSIKRLLGKNIGIELGIRILIGIRATYLIGEQYAKDHPGSTLGVNRQIGRFGDGQIPVSEWIDAFNLRPDIVDRTLRTVYEVKSRAVAVLGAAKIVTYIANLNFYWGVNDYRAGTWSPRGVFEVVSLPGIQGLSSLPTITFRAENIGGGVIAYDTNIPLATITAIATATDAIVEGGKLVAQLRQVRLDGQISVSGLIAMMGFV